MDYPIDRLCVTLNLTALKYVAISIFVKEKNPKNVFLLRICSFPQEKSVHAL